MEEDDDFGIDELFVVTLVTAATGEPIGLPAQLVGTAEVKAALDACAEIGPERHSGFEVIWTPAAESDILGRDELLTAFPELASV